MDRPIIMPRLFRRLVNNRFETVGGETGYADNHGSAPFLAGSIVVLTSALLNPVVTDGVLAAAWAPHASVSSSTPAPPADIRANRHYPITLQGMLFLISVIDASGNVGQAAGAPQMSEITIGSSYAMRRPTSGTYDKYQLLDVDDTTNTLFTVVDKPSKVDGVAQDANTYNPIVLVKIIDSKLQVLG